jgi:hypothetical protein
MICPRCGGRLTKDPLYPTYKLLTCTTCWHTFREDDLDRPTGLCYI